ncbi:MAG: hypothetical protein HQ510_07110 [Candidatus Marinimicrobia bacterium]|nr:hypothetical protein [Candidatus Neomarinimicrobiota bacterium]
MITAKSKEGIQRRLIFNESILLTDKYDELTFLLHDKIINYGQLISFKFSDKGGKYTSDVKYVESEKHLIYTLYNWYSESFVELTEPIILITEVTKHKIWLVWRIQGSKDNSVKTFHLSAWVEEDK